MAVRGSLAAARRLGAPVMIAQAGDERAGVPREAQHAALVKVLKAAADDRSGARAWCWRSSRSTTGSTIRAIT